MRHSLAGSLIYLQSVLGDELGISGHDAKAAADHIRSHRVVPGLFGRYYKLVLAIESNQHEDACQLFREICLVASCEAGLTVDDYSEAALGADKRLFGDLIERDATGLPWLAPPKLTFDLNNNVREAFDMIEAVDNTLAHELRSLIVQVVGASPSHQPGVQSFGSASSFMLWGLVVFNVERYRTVLEIIPTLVHEAAHLLLFAHSIEEPLVTNPIDALYSSPLRRDQRPMDGVFHATFVAARMHYVTQKLRQATKLDLEKSRLLQLDNSLIELRGQYEGGLQTVEQYAALTVTGRQIIDETREYMKAA